MNVEKTNLPGVMIIKPKVHVDERGYFKEIYHEERYKEFGIDLKFVQDNHSRSKKGVIRGLHYQKSRPQGKLVSCIRGSIYDVTVDIDPDSITFGQYVGINLSEENHKQVWIPPGYAHGFCVTSEEAEIQYKCTDIYYPEDEAGIKWDDESISINWPIKNPIITNKDLNWPKLKKDNN